MNIQRGHKLQKAKPWQGLLSSLKTVFQNKVVGVGAQLSLLLNDPVDAMKYDAYICQWLADFYPDYDSYALGFWVDYLDVNRVEWEILVLRRNEGWQLVKLPNPHYNAKS